MKTMLSFFEIGSLSNVVKALIAITFTAFLSRLSNNSVNYGILTVLTTTTIDRGNVIHSMEQTMTKKVSSVRTSSKIHATAKNNVMSTAPIVGILSQPYGNHDRGNDNHNTTTQQYIAASYIKWLEAGGVRAIPIPYDATSNDLLDDLFSQMNGLFLPGGVAAIPYSVLYLLDKAVASNAVQETYFPVWGTCLGYEFMIQYFGSNYGKDDLNAILESGYGTENISLPLSHVIPRELYNHNDSSIYDIVQKYNVTLNNHHQGISSKGFYNNTYLSSLFYVTSTNYDVISGREFVSTIEPVNPTKFPFYGVQYHPEKNAFEYATYPGSDIPYEAIDHSIEGIEFSMYMAQFVGNLTRYAKTQQQPQKEQHSYTKSDLYPTVTSYPMIAGYLAFEEIYILPSASHWSNVTQHV